MNFHFIAFLLFSFHQIDAYVLCKETFRACPDDNICSENGQICHNKNDFNLTVRSSWSLLTYKCLNKRWCGPNAYCLDHLNKCVNKDISTCDFYLNAIATSECKNSSLLPEIFETCSRYHLDYITFPYKYDLVIQCADKCLRNEISYGIQNTVTCPLLEFYAATNYTGCYAKCGACFLPQIWNRIAEGAEKWGIISNIEFNPHPSLNENIKIEGRFLFGIGFAKYCNYVYINQVNKEDLLEIKSTAQNLVDFLLEHINLDIEFVFEELFALKESNLPDPSNTKYWILLPLVLFLTVFICTMFVLKKWMFKKKEQKLEQNTDENVIMLKDLNFSNKKACDENKVEASAPPLDDVC